MSEYSRPLGDAVRKARQRKGWTQNQLAALVDVDERTIMNIENYKANTTMSILYPLLRVLDIDPRTIFDVETGSCSPECYRLHRLIDNCNEEELKTLEMVFQSVLLAIRTKDGTQIEEKKSLLP